MKNVALLSIFIACTTWSCSERGTSPNHPRQHLSPYSIELAGLTLYMSEQELVSRLPGLRYGSGNEGLVICRWRTDQSVKETPFRGIDAITFTLYKDSLQAIRIEYTQMFDVEYREFESGVRDKYASMPSDTVTLEWSYDSIRVALTPNRKKHWTGSIATFAPVLEFQERKLYGRWLEDLQRKKIRTIY